MQGHIGTVTIDCIRGDITRQPEFVAVVNAANARLLPGGGVAGAIHRAAGPGLAREAAPLGPIAPGEVVLTGAHHLPNRYVIHCLGPVYGRDEPAAEILARCYRGALELAERHGIESVVFPAISTGAFGYPLPAAARVAMEATAEVAPRLKRVRRVRFALFGAAALEAHERELSRVLGRLDLS
ncbi:MAG: macro domain-containing protein [Gemmatimonadota bacterium]|nr:MAG: macro domain-containing protein [Gemmatimonadota bacterium]